MSNKDKKLFKGITVRLAENGCGIDKKCPSTGEWSVFFTSRLSTSENDELWALFN